MSDMEQDNRSEMQKRFQKIACDVVEPIRNASDCAFETSPKLVLEVQARVAKAIEQVYYGFHPDLEQTP